MSDDGYEIPRIRNPDRVRFHLWMVAFESAVHALETAIRFRKSHDRALKKYLRTAPKGVPPGIPVGREFVKPLGLDRMARMDDFNFSGLTSADSEIILAALFDKACVEIMTVFGPMGGAGEDVAANDSAPVKAAREALVARIAATMNIPVNEVAGLIDQIKVLRNEEIAHRSGAEIRGVQIIEIRGAGGSASGILYSRRNPRGHPHEPLLAFCKAAADAAGKMAFPDSGG